MTSISWISSVANELREYFNFDPSIESHALLNILFDNGTDEYMLILEPSVDNRAVLMTILYKETPFNVARQLRHLFELVDIGKSLPTPVHIALKSDDTVALSIRVTKLSSNRIVEYAEILRNLFIQVKELQ